MEIKFVGPMGSIHEFAFMIDQRINISKTGETLDEAADALIAKYPDWINPDYKQEAIKEFCSWHKKG